MRAYLCVLALLAACSPPAPESGRSTHTEPPAEAAALVEQAMPGFSIMSVEREEEGGEVEWEIAGMDANGVAYEFDIMQADDSWSVLEIQRDIPWEDAPQQVRDAVAAAPNGFDPVRVIESRQPADGSIVYELFTVEQPAHNAVMEVRFMNGEAEILPPAQ